MDNSNPKELKTVCGDVITNVGELPSAEYNGETVYFCGEECLKNFEAGPDKYIASHNIPTNNGE
jgi:YHS domain-containing protein